MFLIGWLVDGAGEGGQDHQVTDTVLERVRIDSGSFWRQQGTGCVFGRFASQLSHLLSGNFGQVIKLLLTFHFLDVIFLKFIYFRYLKGGCKL